MTLVKITKDGDELTRHGFISGLEDYIKQLLMDPKKASISKYLMSHGLSNEELLPLLLKRAISDDENSAILLRKESIKTDPETGKDRFSIKYMFPREKAYNKMRTLYTNLFENYQTSYNLLEEDGECGDGATSADASGQFIQPLFGSPIKQQNFYSDTYKKKKNGKTDKISMPDVLTEKKKKTIIISEEQFNKLMEEVECNTAFGDFGYDAPASVCKKDDPSMKRHNGKGGSISVNTIDENIGQFGRGTIRKIGNALTKAATLPFSLQSCSSQNEPTMCPAINGKKYVIIKKDYYKGCASKNAKKVYGVFTLGVEKDNVYDDYWHENNNTECNNADKCHWIKYVTVKIFTEEEYNSYDVGDLYVFNRQNLIGYFSSPMNISDPSAKNSKDITCQVTRKFGYPYDNPKAYYLEGIVLDESTWCQYIRHGDTLYLRYDSNKKKDWDKVKIGEKITSQDWCKGTF